MAGAVARRGGPRRARVAVRGRGISSAAPSRRVGRPKTTTRYLRAGVPYTFIGELRPRHKAGTQPVVIYPASGTGAWEAALTNTLSPGDRVLCFETGHFATLWQEMAGKLGLEVDFVPGDWRHGAAWSSASTARVAAARAR